MKAEKVHSMSLVMESNALRIKMYEKKKEVEAIEKELDEKVEALKK